MRVWNRELMTSDFLGPVTEIFVFALILLSWIPTIISMSLPFPWSQLEVGFSQLWFRLSSRSFPIFAHLPDTNRGTCLFQHPYDWNPLLFNENRVCRPRNRVHQHPGQEHPKCEWLFSETALLIPEPLQAFIPPVPGQSCHFLIKHWERQPQEDIIQDSGLSRRPHGVLFKGGIAVAARILGESETHTSQHEPLGVTPTNIQTQHNSWFYSPLLVSIKGFSH